MAGDRTVTQAGFQLIIANGSVTRKVRVAVVDGLKDVAAQYRNQIRKNISLDDHTLQELRKLGHPYSRDKGVDSLHDDRLVHEQSGKLKGSIRVSAVEETTTRRFSVFISSSDPVMPWLLYGTATMRPRRFHEKSYEDIKSKFWKPVLDQLKKVQHRIQLTIRER